eukprot:4698182-Prymnesium_polylepis.2
MGAIPGRRADTRTLPQIEFNGSSHQQSTHQQSTHQQNRHQQDEILAMHSPMHPITVRSFCMVTLPGCDHGAGV